MSNRDPYSDSFPSSLHTGISILDSPARLSMYHHPFDPASRIFSAGSLWYAKIPSGSHLTEMLALICLAFPR